MLSSSCDSEVCPPKRIFWKAEPIFKSAFPKHLFKGVSTGFGRSNAEKCFENALWNAGYDVTRRDGRHALNTAGMHIFDMADPQWQHAWLCGFDEHIDTLSSFCDYEVEFYLHILMLIIMMWLAGRVANKKIAQFRDQLREYGLGTHIGPTMHRKV